MSEIAIGKKAPNVSLHLTGWDINHKFSGHTGTSLFNAYPDEYNQLYLLGSFIQFFSFSLLYWCQANISFCGIV